MSLGDILANAFPKDDSFEVVAKFSQLDKKSLKVEKHLYQNLNTGVANDKKITPCLIAEEMQLNNLNVVLPHFS